jgi:hypothetical protein
MAIKIERGVSRGAVRTTLYGTEGIGKTTLAAQWPNPVILDTERGTRQIDCARVRCPDWIRLHGALVELGGDPQGFDTVVVDSVDWAERLIIEAMLKRDDKKSIEDYGFGKGFVKLAEQFGKLLSLLDGMIDRGVHVVLVGHSVVKRQTPPDMDEGFDRFELKLSKQVGPLVKEWSDLLLFANYRTTLVEGTGGRTRAKGGKERVIHAERCAAWDAKNRFGLPASMPMEWESIGHLFPANPKANVQEIAGYIRAAKDLRGLGNMVTRLDTMLSEGQITDDQWGELTDLADARHDEIDPKTEAAT